MAAGAPLVSVLVNNFNYARYLGQAVESALSQDYPAVEVVVVDDRSTDDSLEVLAAFGDAVAVVALETNGGQAHTLNHGLPHCRGELVAMLDADDAFRPGKLAAVAELARRHPDATLLCDRVAQITARGVDWGEPIPRRIPCGQVADEAFRRGGFWECPPMSGLTFRRAFLERLLPEPALPHRVSFDHYLANLAALTAPVAALQEAFTLRRLHDRNKYKHPDRIQRRRWTLEDDMRRIERMTWLINQGLERLGEPRRLNVDDKLWYRTVRYWAGEIGLGDFLATYLSRPPDRRPDRLLRGALHARRIRARVKARDG